MARILYIVNHLPFLRTHRLPLVLAARDAGHEVRVAYGGDDPPDILEAHGLPGDRLPFDRAGWRFAEYWKAPSRLAALFHQYRPDLIHAFPLKMILYAARAAGVCRPAASPPPALAGSVTGLGYLFTDQRLHKRLLRRWALQRLRRSLASLPGKRIIVQNDDDLAVLAAARIAPAEAFCLIPGAGVCVDTFRPRPPEAAEWDEGAAAAPGLPRMDARPLAVLPARMLRDKGVAEFVGAARILRREGLSARFMLVGGLDPGNPAGLAADTLRRWAAEGAIEWAGWVEDMPALWRQAAVACLPSYREGCPKALLEAMAAGRPCVSTRVPGCREAVRDGVNGRLVAARDTPALAAALREILTNPDLRRQWGAAGRRLAVERFSLAGVIAQTLAVYEQALAANAKMDAFDP